MPKTLLTHPFGFTTVRGRTCSFYNSHLLRNPISSASPRPEHQYRKWGHDLLEKLVRSLQTLRIRIRMALKDAWFLISRSISTANARGLPNKAAVTGGLFQKYQSPGIRQQMRRNPRPKWASKTSDRLQKTALYANHSAPRADLRLSFLPTKIVGCGQDKNTLRSSFHRQSPKARGHLIKTSCACSSPVTRPVSQASRQPDTTANAQQKRRQPVAAASCYNIRPKREERTTQVACVHACVVFYFRFTTIVCIY